MAKDPPPPPSHFDDDDKPQPGQVEHDEAQTQRQAPNDAAYGEPAGGE